MPTFSLDDDRIAIRDMARAFADEKIAPYALEWDEKKHFPVDVIRETAPLGIGAIYMREDVGGSANGDICGDCGAAGGERLEDQRCIEARQRSAAASEPAPGSVRQ